VSATVNVPPLFGDGFESGNLGAWTSSKGLTVQSAIVKTGSFAARGVTTTGVTYAKKTLATPSTDVTYKLNFRYDGSPPTPSGGTIIRLRTAADKALVGLYVSGTGRLGMRNEVTAVSRTSTRALTAGQWYALQLHAVVNGTTSTIEVFADGTKLTDVSTTTADLGVTPIGMLQLGENSAGIAYSFSFDDVSAVRGPGGGGGVSSARRACPPAGLRLSGRRRQRVLRRGRVTIYARTSSSCSIAAVARAVVRGGRSPLRSKTVRRVVRPGGRRVLRLTFTRRARARLRRRLEKGPVKMSVVARDARVKRLLARRRVVATP
jgi:hypothetical protein